VCSSDLTFLSTTSSQPPGQWRANAPLANQPGFATVYKCKVPGPMAVPEANRIRVW
jgi:putative endopeptidase